MKQPWEKCADDIAARLAEFGLNSQDPSLPAPLMRMVMEDAVLVIDRTHPRIQVYAVNPPKKKAPCA